MLSPPPGGILPPPWPPFLRPSRNLCRRPPRQQRRFSIVSSFWFHGKNQNKSRVKRYIYSLYIIFMFLSDSRLSSLWPSPPLNQPLFAYPRYALFLFPPHFYRQATLLFPLFCTSAVSVAPFSVPSWTLELLSSNIFGKKSKGRNKNKKGCMLTISVHSSLGYTLTP